jgi:voltage-gated potassium channel
MSTLSQSLLQSSCPARHSTRRLAELLDDHLTRPMFWLALAFLAILAGVSHRIGQGYTTLFEAEVIIWGLLLLWPLFVVEGLLRLWICRRPTMPLVQRLLGFVLLCLAPPLRLGARSYADGERIWLPWLGWNRVDRALRKRLERLFCVPMIVVALMVLPLLAMEFFWLETVRDHFLLSLGRDIGASVVWVAFVIEFVVMISVAQDKPHYCLTHLMDLAVVSLPLVDFLPILRLLRLTRVSELQEISRLGRFYRLRGLVAKLWGAALLLEAFQHLLGDYRQRRLGRLRDQLAEREEELLELRREIGELENELARTAH